MENISTVLLIVLWMSCRTVGQKRHGYTPPPQQAWNPASLPDYSYRPTTSPTNLNWYLRSKNPSRSTIIWRTTLPSIVSRTNPSSNSPSSFIIPVNVQTKSPTSSTSKPSYTKYATVISNTPTLAQLTGIKSYAPTLNPTTYQMSKEHTPNVIPPPHQTMIPTIHSKSRTPTYFTTNGAKLCNTTMSGIFGYVGSHSAYISYNYQIEMKNPNKVLDTLGHLEIALSNVLLPSLFPINCRKDLLKRKLSNSRTIYQHNNAMNQGWISVLVGMSSAPLDLPSSDPCPEQTTPGVCFIVRGRLSLFLNVIINPSLFEALNNASQMIIQSSMNDGELLYSDENIVRILYLNDTNFVLENLGTVSKLNQDGSIMPAYGWVLLILILSLITMTITIVGRYRRSKLNANQQDLENLSYHSVHGDSHSLHDHDLHDGGNSHSIHNLSVDEDGGSHSFIHDHDLSVDVDGMNSSDISINDTSDHILKTSTKILK